MTSSANKMIFSPSHVWFPLNRSDLSTYCTRSKYKHNSTSLEQYTHTGFVCCSEISRCKFEVCAEFWLKVFLQSGNLSLIIHVLGGGEAPHINFRLFQARTLKYLHWARVFLTSLCVSDISLTNWVCRVSGSAENNVLGRSSLSFLYFVYENQTERAVQTTRQRTNTRERTQCYSVLLHSGALRSASQTPSLWSPASGGKHCYWSPVCPSACIYSAQTHTQNMIGGVK